MTIRQPGFPGLLLAVCGLTGLGLFLFQPGDGKFPSLSVQAAPVQSAPAPPAMTAAEQAQAEEVLAAAIANLERYDSISAKIRQRAELLGQKIVGSGTYVQRPPYENRSRLELTLQIGSSTCTQLQVCDGRRLWTHSDVLGEQKITSVDLDRVAESLQLASRSTAADLRSHGLGLGGLPRLLEGVQASFRITAVQEAQLGALPVRVLEAKWRPEKLLMLLSDQQRAFDEGRPLDLGKLPEQMPDTLLLYLGRDDLFPYRIDYRRSQWTKAGQPIDGTARVLATMEFHEVQANVRPDDRAFTFDPGTSSVFDGTDEYLSDRGLPPVK